MKVADYNTFVRRTDQYKDRSSTERHAIALYGLVGEIGSLFSAIKKKLLAEGGTEDWRQPNDEIIEEIGDLVWYCFSLAHVSTRDRDANILTSDIRLLQREIGGRNQRARKIHAALDPSKKDGFLMAARQFPHLRDLTFSDYQRIAFLTARTQGRDLIEVCLAVIWQLGAELLRRTLPEIELTLNKNVADRPVNVVLGEIAWHLAAIASVFSVSMDVVVEKNCEKVNFRANRDTPTPLHDASCKSSERFPRQFEVAFVSVAQDELRMYLNDKRLGDDLTDNAYADDGYRFHDVLHLANVAHLGWSPVFRKLMGKKRKSDDQLDVVEDGARAQIVEELVIKAIHSEGVRLAKDGRTSTANGIVRLFPNRTMIRFQLLKNLRDLVEGLEVWRNQYWEWENAIFDGVTVFHHLRTELQGTVVVDLDARSLIFSPQVCVDLRGAPVGMGMGTAQRRSATSRKGFILTAWEVNEARDKQGLVRALAAKRAIAAALGYAAKSSVDWNCFEIKVLDEHRVWIRPGPTFRERMWSTGTVACQLAFMTLPDKVICTALAIADTAH